MTNQKKSQKNKFAFFGTPGLSVIVLDELEAAGFIPSVVVTSPDEKKGRGLKLTPPPVKVWAEARDITVLQPEHLDDSFIHQLRANDHELFIVVAYGKILPRTVLGIPRRGVLNVHPSLLPRLRGPSPVRSAILNDERAVGVTIMLLDGETDHGPIIAQKKLTPANWPTRALELEEILIREGGTLLAQILPEWIAGTIEAHEQNHDIATYCEKIEKEDGLLDLSADPYKNLLKIRAYEGWPGTHAFFERNDKKIRVGILDAHIENEGLVIDKVKPEGKREMSYEEFLRSGARPV
ncbi:hypothetical protein A3H16_04225 [Candidatus Kaiserbacteria bacterium RIFCSPLOWO2_12_FULL_53_8]|uniref:methionyl-tRNA formyltransferase n=2 Tax=Candidatus Kaiseribacteriota TaxID=1752734 RepID=A0A1F6CTW5_9BACT|nr:MAG: hypothetical protein A2851_00305 [Candidatus Kaiserbacteria bacterium RIFCSPHIGHO2_01_FULL_53_29]OGG92166.1 MAG: hypothetical protein A3H16_04225 [Candidatus Kaiserbacteria bacterium RIFCSPLOWO2_12_FULL_53_8]